MERMDKGDLLHIGAAYVEVHTFKGKDYVTVKDFSTTTNALSKEILELEEENKTLKDNVEFLHTCLDDRDKSIAIMEEENKKLKEKNEKLEEDNINLISFNEHYSPDVIVKYVDRYETLYNEVDIECAKLRDENKKLNIKVASLEGEIKGLNSTIEKLREELSAYDREYYDEDKKAKDIYKKQHSMGFSDFGGYDE